MSRKTEKRSGRSHRMYDPDFPRPGPPHPIHHKPIPPHIRFGRFPPHMMRRDNMYKEMKDLFILSALDEEKDGLTGTQLQELHGIPRGNLIRGLDDLEKQKMITKNSEKLYSITEIGKTYLEDIKQKVAERNSIMDDIAPMDRYANPFHHPPHQNHLIHDLEHLKDKEELSDYFRGLRARMTRHKKHLENRLDFIRKDKKELDELISQIETSDESSIEVLKEKIKEKLKNRIHILGEERLD